MCSRTYSAKPCWLATSTTVAATLGAVGVVVLGARREAKRGARRAAVHVAAQVPRHASRHEPKRLSPLGAVPRDGRAYDSQVVVQTGGVAETHAQRDLAVLALAKRGEVVAHCIVKRKQAALRTLQARDRGDGLGHRVDAHNGIGPVRAEMVPVDNAVLSHDDHRGALEQTRLDPQLLELACQCIG